MSSQTTPSNTSRALPIIIITLAALFYVYEFFLRVMPSAMTAELMRDFDIDASGLGLLGAMFFYGYAPMQIPAGLMFDRYGPRILISLAVFGCSFGTLLFGFTDNYFFACIGRLMIGVTSGFAFIGALVLASRWFEAKYFAFIAGLIQFMGSIGAILGAAPIALVVHQYGWRITQYWSAFAGVALSLLLWVFIRDKPQEPINQAQHHIIHKGTEWQRLKRVLHHRQTWITGVYAFTSWAPMTLFPALWGVPFMMALYGINTAEATQMMAVVWIGVAIFSPIVGWWSNRINSRRIPLLTCSIVSLITACYILYWPNPSWAVMMIMLFFLGAAAGSQVVTFGVVQDNMPPSVAGTAVGFNNMTVIFAGVALQPLVGVMLDLNWNGLEVNGAPIYSLHNYQVALTCIPLTAVIGLVSAMLLRETKCQTQYDVKIP